MQALTKPFYTFMAARKVQPFHVCTAHLFSPGFEKEKLILIRFTFVGLLNFFFHFI